MNKTATTVVETVAEVAITTPIRISKKPPYLRGVAKRLPVLDFIPASFEGIYKVLIQKTKHRK